MFGIRKNNVNHLLERTRTEGVVSLDQEPLKFFIQG